MLNIKANCVGFNTMIFHSNDVNRTHGGCTDKVIPNTSKLEEVAVTYTSIIPFGKFIVGVRLFGC